MPFTFKLFLLLLAAIAAGFILIPVLRHVRKQSQDGLALPLVVAMVVIGGAVTLYATNSEWNWADEGVPTDPAMRALYDMRKAVHDQPQNMSAWRKLGSFYLRYGEINGALDALGKAHELSRGQDAEVNLTLVEALAAAGEPAHMARAAKIISATLSFAPTDRKALWYGGELAYSQGNTELALTRWQTLLDQTAQESTPEAQSVARMLRERIAGVGMESESPAPASAAAPATAAASAPATAAASAPATAAASAPATAAASAPAPTAASAPEAITVNVEIAAEWIGKVAGDTSVFILARAIGQPGPPLAAQRLTVRELPVQITLSDQNAMMPSHRLSGFKDVEVVARVSLGGTPTASPGDYFGAVQLHDGDSRALNVTIDTVQR